MRKEPVMIDMQGIDARNCAAFEPRDFAVDHAAGEKLKASVRKMMDPFRPDSLHFWELKQANATELHFHDHDEYWIWSRGSTLLTLRLPDGRADTFEIGPGWIVYCLRGVEHGHTPREDWACFEAVGTVRKNARSGHLTRTL